MPAIPEASYNLDAATLRKLAALADARVLVTFDRQMYAVASALGSLEVLPHPES